MIFLNYVVHRNNVLPLAKFHAISPETFIFYKFIDFVFRKTKIMVDSIHHQC